VASTKSKRSKGNPAAPAKPRIRDDDDRYPSGFRYSDRFISVVTRILIVILLTGLCAGFAIGAIFGASDRAAWVDPTAISLIAGGVAIPLLASAWLGASAMHKFGGLVGLLLMLGFTGVVAGSYFDNPLWFWPGIGIGVVAGAGFFWLGYRAGVPMWIGGWSVGSSPTVVQSGNPRINRQARIERTAARQRAKRDRQVQDRGE
jgi:hypothetical protein